MRECRPYGFVRGVRGEAHVPTASLLCEALDTWPGGPSHSCTWTLCCRSCSRALPLARLHNPEFGGGGCDVAEEEKVEGEEENS